MPTTRYENAAYVQLELYISVSSFVRFCKLLNAYIHMYIHMLFIYNMGIDKLGQDILKSKNRSVEDYARRIERAKVPIA